MTPYRIWCISLLWLVLVPKAQGEKGRYRFVLLVVYIWTSCSNFVCTTVFVFTLSSLLYKLLDEEQSEKWGRENSEEITILVLYIHSYTSNKVWSWHVCPYNVIQRDVEVARTTLTYFWLSPKVYFSWALRWLPLLVQQQNNLYISFKKKTIHKTRILSMGRVVLYIVVTLWTVPSLIPPYFQLDHQTHGMMGSSHHIGNSKQIELSTSEKQFLITDA